MWVYFSLCKSLRDLWNLFAGQLGLSELKQVSVSFLWEEWQRLTLRCISPFLVECWNRFEIEIHAANWEGPLSFLSPDSREGIADSDTYRNEAGPRHELGARVGIIHNQYCPWHPGVWKYMPFQTGQPVVALGDCRPNVAKSSDIRRDAKNR